RWSDACADAGLEPNTAPSRIAENLILRKVAEACRSMGKFPTRAELNIYRKHDKNFPSYFTIAKRFATHAGLRAALTDWVRATSEFADVAAFVTKEVGITEPEAKRYVVEGSVYLLRSGAHYKIGRSDELERRVKSIHVALPEAVTLVHSIRTDDPPGIEAYWHRRFADRRMNGEWF